jgi:lipoprotein-releasing system ATP-binding protein
VIKATGIIKHYGNLEVLKGVDIEVQKGEIISIVGKSGAGKSTLLHILGCLDQADSGQIFIDHQEIKSQSSEDLAKLRNRKLGFVFQFHHLLPEFTAQENICIPAYLMGTSEEQATKRALELLSYFGLSDRAQHKPGQLSGGEQQRVAIARAIAMKPELILADEPTGNLDTENSIMISDILFKYVKDEGSSLIMVTHDPKLADKAKRKIKIKDGKIK